VSLEEWNDRYRAGHSIDDEPAPLLVDAVRELPPGRALDLACGAGRNALWLARNGWEVAAIDGASEAIAILQQRAGSLPVEARVFDLEAGAPLPFDDESFDVLTILYYLHRPLFLEAARVLKRGGLFVSAIRMHGINPHYCVAPGELRVTFAGWELLHEREGEIAELVARKG
jgi:SAM-dependent methyltransferase